MRLINADELRDIYSGVPNGLYTTGHFITAIDECETIDAAPVVHGRWMKGGYACGENEYTCSACGKTEWRTDYRRMKYCMFCGAKMDLEETS